MSGPALLTGFGIVSKRITERPLGAYGPLYMDSLVLDPELI